MVDTDKSGSISEKELHKAMQRYKVSITQAEVSMLMRVVDPDQSGLVDMGEWIGFMLASEDGLNDHLQDVSKLNAKKNGDKGTGLLDVVMVAVGEAVILLHPPLPSVGVSIGMGKGCQQHLADG